MVGPEGGAGLVEIQRAQQVATEVALVARDLLRCGTTLRHSPDLPVTELTGRAVCKQDRRGGARRLPAIAALFVGQPEEAANRRESPPPHAKTPHRPAISSTPGHGSFTRRRP